jgi:hypothetical protein
LSHKSLALGGLAVFVSIIVATAVLATSYTALNSLQTINPVAALTAITVALIGIVWFKKSKPLNHLGFALFRKNPFCANKFFY